jgi:hypothetical protein
LFLRLTEKEVKAGSFLTRKISLPPLNIGGK